MKIVSQLWTERQGSDVTPGGQRILAALVVSCVYHGLVVGLSSRMALAAYHLLGIRSVAALGLAVLTALFLVACVGVGLCVRLRRPWPLHVLEDAGKTDLASGSACRCWRC